MPRLNLDKYKTKYSYEIPWRSLRSMDNQEARVRGYLERLEDLGIVEWNENAIVTYVYRGEGYYSDAVEAEVRSARHILVEGIGPDGKEIIFLKRISPGSSSSTFYIDGQAFSPTRLAGKNPGVYYSRSVAAYGPLGEEDWSLDPFSEYPTEDILFGKDN